jgi:hypothetical protein
MYPAEGLENEDFSWEDLPETLVGGFSGYVYSRVEPYEFDGVWWYYDAPDDGEKQGIYIERTTSPWEWNSGSVGAAFGPCLITGDGNLTPGDDIVEDQFEATYTVTLPASSVVGSQTLTVNRQSLCVWTSDVGDAVCGEVAVGASPLDEIPFVSLSYNGVGWVIDITIYVAQYLDPEDEETLYWQCIVSGNNNDIYLKFPTQDTPVGDYTEDDFPYPDNEPPYATVSIP